MPTTSPKYWAPAGTVDSPDLERRQRRRPLALLEHDHRGVRPLPLELDGQRQPREPPPRIATSYRSAAGLQGADLEG